ncbi:hypothetical protein [Papillibacter cinnamivorans]|uniref:Uncharacterized protein n=1 Tax=Papillibacter cinnamivorans DSM 12816 TaxID=1122930 RepID=A0A1W1ZB74_9FIRM|nr:hypothetical protein [Papillibacter cinnamivorans]SMC45665.1 hypothetical protein SAMN02745168_0936 [Papillibacter cinnamivorans DSM 12816]
MPVFFISSIILILLTLGANLALPPQKAKKFAALQRALLISCLLVGNTVDIFFYKPNSAALLALMWSVIFCADYFVTDGIRYWKNKDDPETVKSALKGALGFLALLLFMNICGIYKHFVEAGVIPSLF